MKPHFLTFTGVDADTDFDRVLDLSRRFPLEWGVLFSPDRQGEEPRYPAMDVIERFREVPVVKSAHLCGGYSKMVMANALLPLDLSGFTRVQVNSRKPDPALIARFAAGRMLTGIMQTRDLEFPEDEGTAILFDRSGGFGRPPEAWPRHPGDRLVGYAGGISPDNIDDVLTAVDSSGPHWLDMESGIRTDDRLDLDKCEAVAKVVYG